MAISRWVRQSRSHALVTSSTSSISRGGTLERWGGFLERRGGQLRRLGNRTTARRSRNTDDSRELAESATDVTLIDFVKTTFRQNISGEKSASGKFLVLSLNVSRRKIYHIQFRIVLPLV